MANTMAMVHSLILQKAEKGKLNFESKEALQSVLQEYELHARLIEEELEKCKKDHVYLQGEITRLAQENKLLYKQQKSPRERDDGVSDDSLLVDNLQHQLSLALQEKDALESLWKSSLNEVAGLKEKLADYQSGNQLTQTQSRLNNVQKDYTEAIQILESEITFLKDQNGQLTEKSKSLENQLEEVTSQVNVITEKSLSLKNSLDEMTAKEQDWKSRFLSLEADYIKLDKAYLADKVKFAHLDEYERVGASLKDKLESVCRQRDELQSALERCQNRMEGLLHSDADNRVKVEEALSLVEEAMDDRERALLREASSTEEVERMKGELDTLVKEAGERVAEEVAAVRKQFEHQVSVLKHQLKIAEQEKNRKSKEAEQWQKEYERQQSTKEAPTEKRDKQLEALYQEVHFAEAQCLQLEGENRALNIAISKLQDKCRKNSKEKLKLKCDLKSTSEICNQLQQELALMADRADLLNSQLNQTELQLTQLQDEVQYHRENCKNIHSKSSLANTIELYKYFDESYGQMNDKWKNEMTALTEKFESKMKKLKAKKRNPEKEAPNDNS